MKKKSDYAFVLACNPGYGFGMLSTMNAQNYFNTNADWEIAYSGYSQEEREKISAYFPRCVTWTAQDELIQDIEDRRIVQGNGIHLQWLSGWILAHKLLKAKKYKAVCIIQADAFLFINLDTYFESASSRQLICSEMYGYPISDFKYGDLRNNKLFWFGIFDSLVFIGQDDFMLPFDFVKFHETIDWYCSLGDGPVYIDKVESNPLFIEIMGRIANNKIIGLNTLQWVGDTEYHLVKYSIDNEYRFFRQIDSNIIQLYGWHKRWWLKTYATRGPELFNNNINLTISFMEMFNNMIPEISSKSYIKELAA
jgi:hypothetical protein